MRGLEFFRVMVLEYSIMFVVFWLFTCLGPLGPLGGIMLSNTFGPQNYQELHSWDFLGEEAVNSLFITIIYYKYLD